MSQLQLCVEQTGTRHGINLLIYLSAAEVNLPKCQTIRRNPKDGWVAWSLKGPRHPPHLPSQHPSLQPKSQLTPHITISISYRYISNSNLHLWTFFFPPFMCSSAVGEIESCTSAWAQAVINPAKMERLTVFLSSATGTWSERKSLCKSTQIGIDPPAHGGRVIPFGTIDLFHLLWRLYDHYRRF